MPHGSGTTLATVAAFAATALTGLGPAAPARADTHDAVVSVTDGCGRVDSLEVDTKGDYWVEVLPDGKAPTTAGAPNPGTPGDPPVYQPFTDRWVRPMDKAKAFTTVRVLEWDNDRGDFVYLPLVWSHAPGGTRGTEMLKLTNEDCVQPEEPTFTDEEGSAQDTVTIPSTPGVKYSGKPGVTPGTGTVTVTATADKGFRLATPDGVPLPADQTRWSHTFDGTAPVSVPAGKSPTIRLGRTVPSKDPKKPATVEPNVVVVPTIEGVSWVVDGKAVKPGKGGLTTEVPVGDKVSVVVVAVSADPKKYALQGRTTWTVGIGIDPTRPVVAALTENVAVGRSMVHWTAPEMYGPAPRFNLRYRQIALNRYKLRSPGPWKAWLVDTPATSSTLRAKPGMVFEVQAQAVDPVTKKTSGWSRSAQVLFPIDVTPRVVRPWVINKERSALGGTMLATNVPGSIWRVATPTTDRIAIWFGTSNKGGKAAVYVDGRQVATVNTYSPRTRVRQRLFVYNTRWRAHDVSVIARDGGAGRKMLRIDGIAYGR